MKKRVAAIYMKNLLKIEKYLIGLKVKYMYDFIDARDGNKSEAYLVS